ncbi:MAG: hypothetical protein APF76_18200 [Desulfitibacter sp. BRH_c19]|nr:MAG: hypothetical protein APF76_18200 [Desulfitibacter sp. BRH_c19]
MILKIISEKINTVVEVILFSMLVTMTIAVFLQILFRYLLNAPLYWTEELSRYLMIWIVYLGSSVGIKRGAHVGFSYFVNLVGPKIANWFYMMSFLGIAAFCVNITYYGLIVALRNMKQLSPALQLPIGFVYMALPVAGVLCLIQLMPLIINTYKKITTKSFEIMS